MSLKIPLFQGKSLGFDRDMVIFSIKSQRIPLLFAKAVVDNGCPFTIVSEVALKQVRINYNNYKERDPLQLGPILLRLLELGECKLIFRDENNNPVTFKQDVHIGLAGGIVSHEIPSFIGKDFLDKHYLSLLKAKEGNFLIKSD